VINYAYLIYHNLFSRK